MLLGAWLFVGVTALLWTVLTVVGAIYVRQDDGTGDSLATVAGVVGFVLWGVWTFGALNIEVARDSTTYTYTHPELAILGVTLALVPGYIALTGPIELVRRARDTQMRDV